MRLGEPAFFGDYADHPVSRYLVYDCDGREPNVTGQLP